MKPLDVDIRRKSHLIVKQDYLNEKFDFYFAQATGFKL